jgi:hypothetical protein
VNAAEAAADEKLDFAFVRYHCHRLCPSLYNEIISRRQLTRIRHKDEKFYDGCGNERAIHVPAEPQLHDRRYAASL